MHEASVKKLTGSARLAVANEAPAGRVPFTFSPDARLFMSTCEEPFITDRQPLWRRLDSTK